MGKTPFEIALSESEAEHTQVPEGVKASKGPETSYKDRKADKAETTFAAAVRKGTAFDKGSYRLNDRGRWVLMEIRCIK